MIRDAIIGGSGWTSLLELFANHPNPGRTDQPLAG
jgi:hypothetical protein